MQMARRCCLCGAYLDSRERCDCGGDQTNEVPRGCRKPVRRVDEASRTGEDWRWEKYINEQYQRWYEC